MVYMFRPPSVRETPAGFGRLFSRIPIHRANTILVTDGVATSVRTPSVQETQAANFCYQGGHAYVLTDAEYTMLVGLGFGANITVE